MEIDYTSQTQNCPRPEDPFTREFQELNAKTQVLLTGLGMGLKEYGIDRVLNNPAALCTDIAGGAGIGLALSRLPLPRPWAVAVTALAALPVIDLVERAEQAMVDTNKALSLARFAPEDASKQIANSLGHVTADVAYLLASGIGAFHLGNRLGPKPAWWDISNDRPKPPNFNCHLNWNNPPKVASAVGIKIKEPSTTQQLRPQPQPQPFHHPNIDETTIRW